MSQTTLHEAMRLVSELNTTHGVTQRGGKKYTQVVHRMEAFRKVFGLSMGVDTEILVDDGQRVVVKAVIINENGVTVGSGTAEEIRGQGNVNKTSAVENAETSAIGRALSSIGLAGGEYASANEMEAVGRKEDELKKKAETTYTKLTQDSETNQAGQNSGSPPTGQNAPSDPPSGNTKKEPGYEEDSKYYISLKDQIERFKTTSQVEKLFNEEYDNLKALKKRSQSRYEHAEKLFNEKIAELNILQQK
jgi:hypothetical protein